MGLRPPQDSREVWLTARLLKGARRARPSPWWNPGGTSDEEVRHPPHYGFSKISQTDPYKAEYLPWARAGSSLRHAEGGRRILSNRTLRFHPCTYLSAYLLLWCPLCQHLLHKTLELPLATRCVTSDRRNHLKTNFYCALRPC